MEKQKEYLDRYKRILLEIISNRLPHCKIYLFGSRARERHSSGSDIDLALDNGKKIDFDIIVKLKIDIDNSIIPLGVDLVDLNNASEKLREQVKKEGVLWKN
jgi:uncharacterized protein